VVALYERSATFENRLEFPGLENTGGFKHFFQLILVETVHALIPHRNEWYRIAAQVRIPLLSFCIAGNVVLLIGNTPRIQKSFDLLTLLATWIGKHGYRFAVCYSAIFTVRFFVCSIWWWRWFRNEVAACFYATGYIFGFLGLRLATLVMNYAVRIHPLVDFRAGG
jgi:hypothetical protein